MYRIRLKDGTVLSVRFCAARSGVLTLNVVSELDFMDIADIFSDPDKTDRVEFLYGEMSDVHEGYTKLVIINGATAGEYLISLRKEQNT